MSDDKNDIERLKQFINDVEEDIIIIINHPRIMSKRNNLKKYFSSAWEDIENMMHMIKEKFHIIEFSDLETVGLYDAQLELKLKIYYDNRNKFKKLLDKFKKLNPTIKNNKYVMNVSQMLRRSAMFLLNNAVTIIDSLKNIIFGLELLSEMIKVIVKYTLQKTNNYGALL